jgi:hypothetical protein
LAIRVFDATIIGLVLISLIFLGMVFLLVDIPVFNSVNPFSLEIAILGVLLGLTFGLVTGHWYTVLQLKILFEKNEFKGLGLKRMYYALFSGLAVFLICSFFVFYYRSVVLGNGLVTFVISATFAAYIIRLVRVTSWEKRTRKTIMMSKNRFYIIVN